MVGGRGWAWGARWRSAWLALALECLGVSDPENETAEVREVLERAVVAAGGFLDGLGTGPGAPRGRDEVAEAFASEPLPQEGAGGVAAVDELVASGVPSATGIGGTAVLSFRHWWGHAGGAGG